MRPVLVPTTDVNSETGVLVAWRAEHRARVEKDAPLAELETSKAILEVLAPDDGYLLHLGAVGDELPLTAPIAQLFDSLEALLAHEAELTRRRAEEEALLAAGGVRATAKAKQRAEELGVDLAKLGAGRLITVKEVEAAAEAARPVDLASLPAPLPAAPGVQRVLIIGGGLGATQVIDIFRDSPQQAAVAILDDSKDKWGGEVYGVPVCGGTDRLAPLFAEGAYDAVVVAISTSIPARTKFRELCQKNGIPMANAIDRTAKLSADVTIGEGNVICAFCHFGTSAKIGDNNFFSAYNSYDHHAELGSDISTGPSVVTSGRVKIGDRCRLGTGVFIEPGLELGAGVKVASGAVILRSVPADHAVKTKLVTTAVVPLKR